MAGPTSFQQSPFQNLIDEQNQPKPLIGSEAVTDTPLPTIPSARGDEEDNAPAPAPAPAADPQSLLPPPELRPMFETVASHFNVPVNVLMALAHQESSYNASAKNASGASGMAQYMPATAKSLGINPNDPNEAIPAMAQQLRERLDKGYSMADAVKEHFAGTDRKGWGNKTAAYGDQVLAKAGAIGQELYGDDSDAQPQAKGTVDLGSIDPSVDMSGAGGVSASPQTDMAEVPAAAPDTAQNEFSMGMSRADYLDEFKKINPKAPQAAIDAVMAQYDQKAASSAKAQADTKAAADAKAAAIAKMPADKKAEALAAQQFNDRLNARLQGPANGIVPQLPDNQQPYMPHVQTPFDRLREELRYAQAVDNGENPAPLPESNVNPADLDAQLSPKAGGPGRIATNAAAGAWGTILGVAATGAQETGHDDAAAQLDAARARISTAAQRNGGDTIIGKTANLGGAIAPAAVAGGAGLVTEAATNLGLFGAPAFRDTYKDQIAKGASQSVAIYHALAAAGINTALPMVAPGGSKVLTKALGAADAQGARAAAIQFAQAAGEGAGFSVANSAIHKGIDVANGIENNDPWVNGQGAADDAASFMLLRGAHMAPHVAEAGLDKVAPGYQVGRALAGDVADANFDPNTVQAAAAARMTPDAYDPNAITPQETARATTDVGPSPMTRTVSAPADMPQQDVQGRIEPTMGNEPAPPAGPLTAALDDVTKRTATPTGNPVVDQMLAIRPMDTPPAGPLEAALTDAAAAHAANPAPMPEAPAAAPQPPDYSTMSRDELKSRMQDAAQRIKAATDPKQRVAIQQERATIEREIGARGKQAVSDSKPAVEPLTAGPFDNMGAANKMMTRFAAETGRPHEVVKQGEQFIVKPMGEVSNGIDSSGASGRPDGSVRSGEPAAGVGRSDSAGHRGDGSVSGRESAGQSDVGASVPRADAHAPVADGAANHDAAVDNPTISREQVASIKSALVKAHPDDRELWADRLQHKLEKKGALTRADIPRDLSMSMDTVGIMALNKAIESDPHGAIEAIRVTKEKTADVPERQEVPEEAPLASGAESAPQADTAQAAKPRTTLADAKVRIARQEEAVRVAAENIARRKAEKAAPTYKGLTEDEYINRINPTGERREFAESMPASEFADLPISDKVLGTAATHDGNKITLVAGSEVKGSVVAVVDGKVVGYMAPESGTTGLFVANEFRGKGIGEALSTFYRSREPFAQSGGMSEAGEKIARKVFRHLAKSEKDQQTTVTEAPPTKAIPTKSAGDRMRERVQADNPFMAFLATHGIHMDERSDTGGHGGKAGIVMVPGYGSLYRKSGERMDELASLAHDAGFLSDADMAAPTDNGGTRKLAEMIARAVHGKEVIKHAADVTPAEANPDHELFAEAAKLGIETEGKSADQVYDEVASHHAAQFDDEQARIAVEMARDADIPLDGGETAPDHLTDEKLDEIFPTAGSRHQGEDARDSAEPAHAGAEETGSTRESATGAEGSDGTESGRPSDEPADTGDAASVSERKDDPYTRDLFGGQDLFDHIDTRPGTLPAQKAVGRAAISDLARRLGVDRIDRNNPEAGSSVSVLGSRLLANFVEGKPNQLVGQHVKSTHDLAVLAQVYRDPRFETFRVFYVGKGGEVVGESGYTSRMAAAVHMPNDLFQQIAHDKARFGSQGYYLLHNHPSGHSEPSPADVNMTRHVDQNVPGMLGHVVIDHNEYSVIHGVGNPKTIDAPHLNGKDFTGMPEMEHALLGVKLTDPDAVARAAKALQVPDGHATLILTTARGETQLLVDVPMGAVSDLKTGDDFTRAKAMIRRMTREAGAGGHRFLVLPDSVDIKSTVFLKALAHGMVTDVVNAKGESLQNKGFYFGGDFVAKGRPKVLRTNEGKEVAEPVDQYGDRRAEDRDAPDRRIHTVQVDGVRRPIENSRGQLIAPDAHQQMNFWRWAKDTAVVDSSGRPEVVYHATFRDFSEFKTGGELGAHFGTAEQANALADETGSRVMPAYVSIQKPLRLEDAGTFRAEKVVPQLIEKGILPPEAKPSEYLAKDGIHESPEGTKRLQDAIKAAGFDGVVYHNTNEGNGDSYIAFDPEQVKSAIGNDGRYDLANPSIVAEQQAGYGAGEPKYEGPAGKELYAVRSSSKTMMDTAGKAWREVLMFADPMGRGALKAQRVASDYERAIVKSNHQWNGLFRVLSKSFTPEQHRAMWEAGDEQNVLMQQGLPTEGKGIDRLPKDQREVSKLIHGYGNELLAQAKAEGMYEGEGLPYWTTRMAVQIGEDGDVSKLIASASRQLNAPGSATDALGFTKDASSLKQRKYLTTDETEKAAQNHAEEGKQAVVVRDLRANILALARLEKAIAGRRLLNQIKAEGLITGEELIGGDGDNFVEVNHPAFVQWKPDMIKNADGEWEVSKNQNGEMNFKPTYLKIRKDWEGPLRAVLASEHDFKNLYKGYMRLKAESMNYNMASPLIHNMVILGRAAAYGKPALTALHAYSVGRKLRTDYNAQAEMIERGMNPIGNHGFMQDITGLAAGESIDPGRSLTAKAVSGLIGAINKSAGDKTARALDKAGDFWHGTLLWDMIGDLQRGLYVHMKTAKLREGLDEIAAGEFAGHFANRFAGSIRNSAMSSGARQLLNVLMFSRSFTVGNLGIVKDIIQGVPSDSYAQVYTHSGADQAARLVRSGRKEAVSAFIKDYGLSIVTSNLAAAALIAWKNDDLKKGIQDVAGQYRDNYLRMLKMGGEHWSHWIDPWFIPDQLSLLSRNEPGKTDRIRTSTEADQTAIYTRNPSGKVPEEIRNWLTHPVDTLTSKLAPLPKSIWEGVTNKVGKYDQHLYPEKAAWYEKAMPIIKHVIASEIPAETIKAHWDILTGNESKQTNQGALSTPERQKAAGFWTGLTTSHGYPGGPEAGLQAEVQRDHREAVDLARPDIRDALKHGDTQKAIKIMKDAGMSPNEMQSLIRRTDAPAASSMSKTAMKNFVQHATPDQIDQYKQMRQDK